MCCLAQAGVAAAAGLPLIFRLIPAVHASSTHPLTHTQDKGRDMDMLMMVFLLLWLSGIPLLLMEELAEHYYNNKEQGKEQ